MKIPNVFIIFAFFFILSACSAKDSQTGQQSGAAGGFIQNKGSDTMVNLALAWAEQYQASHPETRISVTGGGSGTGIAALMNRTVDIANASRSIKAEEKATAEKNGVDPVEIVVARDAIAVIVHPDNPVNRLTLQQVADIYSGKINNWSQVGGEDRPIVRLSRETNSGTHVYFLERVLRMGDSKNKTLFSSDTLLLPSSEGITAEASDNPNAIGYDGLGYITPHVKVLAISEGEGKPYVLPSVASVDDKSYPIARDLYMYTDGQASGTIKAYLDWIMTPEAQKTVADLGFIPIVNP
jgi:phosphate transport system substrate-binding protein